MKTSKHTQKSNDNDFEDYQNLPPVPDHNWNPNVNTRRTAPQTDQFLTINHSEEVLLNSSYEYYTPSGRVLDGRILETNTNAYPTAQTFEMVCSCPPKEYTLKSRLKGPYANDQTIAAVGTRSCCSTPKLEEPVKPFSHFSLDRKTTLPPILKHGAYKGLQRNCSLKRLQSPEIISTHHVPPIHCFYDGGYGAGPFTCEADVPADEYGFGRPGMARKTNERSVSGQQTLRSKKRMAGDGMDSGIDETEVMMFDSDYFRPACRCSCDHVIYGSGYNCLQEERLPPAPDLTRRLGTASPIGKPELGTPPYYRTASGTTNSSSTNSASSRMELSTRHWWIIVTVLLLAAAAGVGVPIALKISAGASLEERLEFAARLLQEVPLIDGHNDLPWNIRKFLHNRLKDFQFGDDLRNVTPWSSSAWSHTDLPRMKQGHVAAQFWAAYVPCDSQYKDAVQLTLEQIDIIRRFTELYQPSLTLCTSAEDIKAAFGRHQVCSLIGVEGGHSLAGSLGVLRTLYHVGVRYLTLTSTCNTPWADCSHEDKPGKKPEHGGLTTFGKTVVKEMNRLGMIVDLSHVSVRTMRDALAVSKAPVIFSHSSAHSLCNSTRNVPDATLRKLALNRGIIMVNFYAHFLTCKDVATVSDAVAHINHIRDVAGVDNVGLGAGYDGINFVPKGLEDVSTYPNLFAELIGTGRWSTDDLKKLAGLNFLRVLEDVERVRDEFKKARVPPYEDVLTPRPNPNNCSSQDLF